MCACSCLGLPNEQLHGSGSHECSDRTTCMQSMSVANLMRCSACNQKAGRQWILGQYIKPDAAADRSVQTCLARALVSAARGSWSHQAMCQLTAWCVVARGTMCTAAVPTNSGRLSRCRGCWRVCSCMVGSPQGWAAHAVATASP